MLGGFDGVSFLVSLCCVMVGMNVFKICAIEELGSVGVCVRVYVCMCLIVDRFNWYE